MQPPYWKIKWLNSFFLDDSPLQSVWNQVFKNDSCWQSQRGADCRAQWCERRSGKSVFLLWSLWCLQRYGFVGGVAGMLIKWPAATWRPCPGRVHEGSGWLWSRLSRQLLSSSSSHWPPPAFCLKKSGRRQMVGMPPTYSCQMLLRN